MYQLSPFVFACNTGRNCMFLDLRRDRYISAPQPLMAALAPWITDWHLTSTVPPIPPPNEIDVDKLLKDLLNAGILCTDRRPTVVSEPIPAATHTGNAWLCRRRSADPPYTIRMRSILDLLRTDFSLRTVGLWRIVTGLSARAEKLKTSSHPDLSNAAETLVSHFLAVRPWYPRDYLCLFDSLALMLFLLQEGIRARLIFGVREDPFAAHCWVQYGSLVLNDYFDRTRLYTPIMAI